MRPGIIGFAVALVLPVIPVKPVDAQRLAHVVAVDSGLVHGDARLLLTGAAERVEMAILGQSRQYSRAQAQLRLAQFFREYPPQTFVWTTEEVVAANWFATGRYQVSYEEEATLRIYAHWQQQHGVWKLSKVHVFR